MRCNSTVYKCSMQNKQAYSAKYGNFWLQRRPTMSGVIIVFYTIIGYSQTRRHEHSKLINGQTYIQAMKLPSIWTSQLCLHICRMWVKFILFSLGVNKRRSMGTQSSVLYTPLHVFLAATLRWQVTSLSKVPGEGGQWWLNPSVDAFGGGRAK